MKLKKILLSFMSFILISCSSYTIHEGDFYFEDKYYNSENSLMYDEDYSLINKALTDKESFGVYVFLSGCTTCASFEPILKEALTDYSLSMYSVNYQVMKISEDTYHDLIKYAPSVMLFKNGELVDYLDPNSSSDTDCFKKKEAFLDWLSSYVKITKGEENEN